ncbi:stress-induced-phosphoprotein 1-like [Styela clava]
MADTDTSAQAMTLKAKGNVLFRDGKYLESIVEYTAAVELDRANPVVYSNRSLAFLKLGQHFYALKDAETTIRLNSDWSKGYYRKGQVEEAAEQYDEAKDTYERGLKVCPVDEGLKTALAELAVKSAERTKEEKFRTTKYIFFSAVFCSAIVALDMNLQLNIFGNPFFRWIFVTFAVFFGMIMSRIRATSHNTKMKQLLAPPLDLLKELENGQAFSKPNMDDESEFTPTSDVTSNTDKKEN